MKASQILQFLVPKDKLFYPLFKELGSTVHLASEKLQVLIDTYPQNKEELIGDIKELEKKADSITHQINRQLEKSLITPFDREDVHKLAHELDDVIDFLILPGKKSFITNPETT